MLDIHSPHLQSLLDMRLGHEPRLPMQFFLKRASLLLGHVVPFLCIYTVYRADTAFTGSHIILQPKAGCPLKLSRAEPGQYLDGRPPEKTRLLLEEVFVRPAGGVHPVVCVGPNAPV